MRTPPGLSVRALIRLFILPSPAPEETYDGGVGTVLPSRTFRRWSIWAPMAFWILVFGVGWIAVGMVDIYQAEDFDVTTWGYAIGLTLTSCLLCFFYSLAVANYYMLEYRFDDLGLHIRKGIGTVQEITLSYRNIQNVAIQRGPIDLLLGMSKLVVETAGGGGAAVAAGNGGGADASMAVLGHRGMMIGIDRFVAEDVRRDLIERMNRFHGAGLGDTSERRPDASRRGGAAGRPAPTLAVEGFGRLVITSEQLELVRETIANVQRATESLLHSPSPYAAATPDTAIPSAGASPGKTVTHEFAAEPPLPPPIDPFSDSGPIILRKQQPDPSSSDYFG